MSGKTTIVKPVSSAWRRYAAAMRFLTIFPLPGDPGEDARLLPDSLVFFPAVGLTLALPAAAVARLLTPLAPPVLLSAIMVLILAVFSGAMHLDGLSDTADGFFSCRKPDRILEIMRDSRVGVMGALALVMAVLLKFAALVSLTEGWLPAAVFLIPLAGRCAIVVNMSFMPYLRRKGLGSVFSRQSPAALSLSLVLPMIVCMCLLGRWRGWLTAMLVLSAPVIFGLYARRKIGGATGDILGATCEISEVTAAIMLAIMAQAAPGCA